MKSFIWLATVFIGCTYFKGCSGYHLRSSYGHFHCYDSGASVSEYRLCDGYSDCWDGSDELNCHAYEYEGSHSYWGYDHNHDHEHDYGHNHHGHHHEHCLETEFRCHGHSHYGSSCIPLHWTCDGYRDCLDGGDEEEEECTCSEHEKTCLNYYNGLRFCVPHHVSCNSYHDTYIFGSGSHDWEGYGNHHH